MSPTLDTLNDRLEKILATPATIFDKYEGVGPAGIHSPTLRCRTCSTTAKPASGVWLRKLVLTSGASRWLWWQEAVAYNQVECLEAGVMFG